MSRNEKGQFLKGTHWREPQVFRDKDWLIEEYVNKERSTGEIGKQFNVTEAAIIFWLQKHGIPRRTISQARKVKYWGLIGPDNPRWGKTGELNPNWKGGISPERPAFYASQEWKTACYAVWRRDDATCQRCGSVHRDSDVPFHVHHIISFKHVETRADVDNLILVCETCHRWIHSNNNIQNEFIKKDENE